MARWWIYAKGLLGLLACCQAAEEAAWTVMCNADCGGVNTCAEKQLCSGRMEETSICPDAMPCPTKSGLGTDCWPQDCQWGEWREWENDGVSGLCTRSRHFSPSQCGGQQCLGTTKDTMYCDPLVHPPSDCEFSEWTDFGTCDPVTLQRNRTRTVVKQPAYGGAACNGPLQLTEPCGDRDAPVACVLGDWMEWSGCTRPCGGGQQTQVRAIMQEAAAGGKLCQGENGSPLVLQKTRPCNVDIFCGGEEAPQDCLMSEWAEWSACDEATPKHRRQRYRSRSIAVPGKNGGQACSESLQEVKGCEVSEVLPPIDCRLSGWSAWSLCDKTCAGGQTFRTRKVDVMAERGGKTCEDSLKETMACNEMDCMVDKQARDCHLSIWDSWSDCSVSCGKGMRTRNREVTAPPLAGGVGCSADIKQVEGCPDLPPCESEDCVWGTWTEWSDCSKPCDGGQKLRNRTVFQPPSKSGQPCHALRSVSEVDSCNTQSCASKNCRDGAWYPWNAWGQCSRPCAGGLKWRHRQVASEADKFCGKPALGPSTETSHCNEWPCEEDSDCVMGLWSSWTDCSASCYGLQTRKREIVKKGTGHGRWCTDPDNQPAALEEHRPCNGPEGASADQQEDCGFGEMQDCLLSSWGRWSSCSKSCGGGFQHRERRTLRESKLGGKPCDGELRQVQSCSTASCGLAMDCQWEDWDQWGACTTCDGEMIRVREIRHLGNDLGQPCEASNSREVAQCNECPKKQTFWCVWGAWKDGACSATCGTGGRVERRRVLQTLSTPPENPLDAVGNVSGVGASCEAYEVDYTTCKDVPLTCSDCIPKDCEFGEWGEWEKPTTCDGICTRKRSIAKLANSCGAACNGNVIETKTCTLEECGGKQDCQFSQWSAWNGCSDGSQQTRVREIVALNGPYGKPCSGAQKETKPCEATQKARDCTLTPWSAWGDCSKRCGGGQKERTREVADHALHGGKPCEVPLKSTMPCEEKLCLGGEKGQEDCVLGDWEEWTGCSKGLQAYRIRSPVREAGPNGLPCSGVLRETGACPELKARDCALSDWGSWGACGATCGGGQRFRTREVKHAAEPGGQPCLGDTHESETCNEEVACDVQHDCVISSWSLWSVCSKSCGQGLYARERKILQAATSGRGCNVVLWEVDGCQGESTSDSCGDHIDCKWGQWKEWSECNQAQYCGLGHRSRSREIAVHPTGSGEKCDPLPKEEVVPDISCAVSCSPSSVCTNGEWGQWSVWGPCSVSCGRGGTRSRSRVEKVKANHCGYPPEGEDVDYEPCNAQAECESEMGAQDCEFGLWGEWEECSASCNGAQKRTREIARYSAYGGTPCHGAIAETQRCNPGPSDQGPPMGCISGAPVDCVQWQATDWSPCTASCGTGHQTRRYEVAVQPAFGGKSCLHPLEETRECQALQECVIEERDCVLTEWQEWSDCEPFTAQRFRKRQVKYSQVGAGKACEGDLSQAEKCSRQCEDKKYFCAWAHWESWSACSESCGTRGRRHRSRGLALEEAAVAPPPAPAVPVADSTVAGPELAPVDTAAVLEEYQMLSRRLKRASGSHADFFMSFLAGAGCFAALAGLVRVSLRRIHTPNPRALLQPFAPNSGENWRQVEVVRETEEA